MNLRRQLTEIRWFLLDYRRETVFVVIMLGLLIAGVLTARDPGPAILTAAAVVVALTGLHLTTVHRAEDRRREAQAAQPARARPPRRRGMRFTAETEVDALEEIAAELGLLRELLQRSLPIIPNVPIHGRPPPGNVYASLDTMSKELTALRELAETQAGRLGRDETSGGP